MIEAVTGLFFAAGAFIMPMLIGMRGDPTMSDPTKWGLHMIGYLVPVPKKEAAEPEAGQSPAEDEPDYDGDPDVFEKWFGNFDHDPREED